MVGRHLEQRRLLFAADRHTPRAAVVEGAAGPALAGRRHGAGDLVEPPRAVIGAPSSRASASGQDGASAKPIMPAAIRV